MKVDSSIFKKRITKASKLPSHLVKSGLKVMKENTPKRSGNARRKTVRRGDSLKANYSYAGPLDAGQSPKAPKGFTDPTIEYWDKETEKYIKRV
jgi:hypothetical protein